MATTKQGSFHAFSHKNKKQGAIGSPGGRREGSIGRGKETIACGARWTFRKNTEKELVQVYRTDPGGSPKLGVQTHEAFRREKEPNPQH